MKIPIRKTEPVQDAEVLSEMGLSPAVKPKSVALELMPKTQSPVDARIESINSLLLKAVEKASTLFLSAEEVKALTADFDEADFVRGAGGDQDKIYLEHVALRKRLNEVVGLGQWIAINRRSWSEEFIIPAKPNKPQSTGVHVYCEAVLLIRGVFVGEAIGEMTYFKNNASQTYADAYEGSKTAAFRRCCKDFGIGLQAYSKDWCEAWKFRYPGFERPERKK